MSNPTPAEEDDFSIFEAENISIPENTEFIAIGSESTEIGIDNVQLTLDPKNETESSLRSLSQIDSLMRAGNLDLINGDDTFSEQLVDNLVEMHSNGEE